MPKPRARAAIGVPSYFSVSPWQDREEQRQADEGPAGYSIVEMPLVVRSDVDGGSGPSAPVAGTVSQPDAMTIGAAEAEGHAAEPLRLPSAAAAAAAAPAAGDGWLTKKRKEAGEGESAAAHPAGGAFPPPVRGGSVGEPDAAAAEQGEHAAELEGTAYLALLPNGSITGEWS